MLLSRRGFLPLLAAPFVVKAASLMPVSSAKLVPPKGLIHMVEHYSHHDGLLIQKAFILTKSNRHLVTETAHAFVSTFYGTYTQERGVVGTRMFGEFQNIVAGDTLDFSRVELTLT